MRIAVIGGGPGRPLLQRARPAARRDHRAAPRDHGVGAQRARRHVRLRGGLQRRDAGRDRARRPGGLRRRCSASSRSGTTSTSTSQGEVVTSGGHAFAAMSRRRLLEILQAPLPRPRRRPALPHAGTRRRRARRVLRPRGGLRRAQLGGPRSLRRHLPARPSTSRDCRYMWLGTDQGLRRLHLPRPRDAVRRDADPRLSLRRHRLDVHRRDDQRGLAARRLRGHTPTGTWAPGRVRREVDRAGPRALRRRPRRARGAGQQLTLDQLHDRPQRVLGTRQRRAARRRRAHRALLDRLGHQARDGGLARPRRLPPRGRRRVGRGRSATYDEERRPVVLSTQRAAQASLEWFENLGQYVHQEPTQFAFNIMTRCAGSPTTTSRMRDPGFVARCDEWFASSVERPPVGRRPGRARRDHAPDVPAVHPPRGDGTGADPAQPGDRLADGPVRRRGGRRRRTSTSCTWPARRSAAPGW